MGLLRKSSLRRRAFHHIHQKQSLGGAQKKKGILKNFAKFTEKQLCQSLFFDKVSCEIFKNTYFYRTRLVTPSAKMRFLLFFTETKAKAQRLRYLLLQRHKVQDNCSSFFILLFLKIKTLLTLWVASKKGKNLKVYSVYQEPKCRASQKEKSKIMNNIWRTIICHSFSSEQWKSRYRAVYSTCILMKNFKAFNIYFHIHPQTGKSCQIFPISVYNSRM